MKRDIPVAAEARGTLLRLDDQPQPPREFHELWFALCRKDWRSAVLVPADAGGSASAAATSLAQVGKQLHDFPMTLVIMGHRDGSWPVMQIVKAATPTDEECAPQDTSGSLDYASAVQVVANATTTQNGGARPPPGKVIVSILPVIAEPLGLAVTQAADVVVLCIEMGRTRLQSARKTIELIGRDRIAGCLVSYSR